MYSKQINDISDLFSKFLRLHKLQGPFLYNARNNPYDPYFTRTTCKAYVAWRMRKMPTVVHESKTVQLACLRTLILTPFDWAQSKACFWSKAKIPKTFIKIMKDRYPLTMKHMQLENKPSNIWLAINDLWQYQVAIYWKDPSAYSPFKDDFDLIFNKNTYLYPPDTCTYPPDINCATNEDAFCFDIPDKVLLHALAKSHPDIYGHIF